MGGCELDLILIGMVAEPENLNTVPVPTFSLNTVPLPAPVPVLAPAPVPVLAPFPGHVHT